MSEHKPTNKQAEGNSKLCIICEKPFIAKEDQQMCDRCSGVLSLFSN